MVGTRRRGGHGRYYLLVGRDLVKLVHTPELVGVGAGVDGGRINDGDGRGPAW